GVPADDLAGEAQAAQRLRARGELHLRRRHLEDVGAAGRVENVRPLEEARERLAVLAVAEEPKAGRRRNLARDAAHVTAPAPKREVEGQPGHVTASDPEAHPRAAYLAVGCATAAAMRASAPSRTCAFGRCSDKVNAAPGEAGMSKSTIVSSSCDRSSSFVTK